MLCGGCGAPVPVPSSPATGVGSLFLPPLLSQTAAAEALRDWAGSRRFAPRDLKLVEGPERSRLVYVPHWSVDAVATSAYRGERGNHYYVNESRTDANGNTTNNRVRKTNWVRVSGEVVSKFADLLIVATRPFLHERFERLAPWPLNDARPVEPESLSGHQVLLRDLDTDEALAAAKSLMAPKIQSACRDDIGGNEQRVRQVDTTYSQVLRRSLLLPVWTAGYRHGGKAWHVLINATTGQVHGRRPYSAWKILVAVGVGVFVVAGVVAAIAVGR